MRLNIIPLALFLLAGFFESHGDFWRIVIFMIFAVVVFLASAWEHNHYRAKKSELEPLRHRLNSETHQHLNKKSIHFNYPFMKTLTTTLLLFVILFIPFQQDITGKWEGKITVSGSEMRIAFNVTKDGATYKSTMDSPDQNAFGIPVSTTTVADKTVKFDLPDIGGVYEGTIAEDQTLKGTWKQSGYTFPMNLTKAKK